jgi:hypothetical protein
VEAIMSRNTTHVHVRGDSNSGEVSRLESALQLSERKLERANRISDHQTDLIQQLWLGLASVGSTPVWEVCVVITEDGQVAWEGSLRDTLAVLCGQLDLSWTDLNRTVSITVR